MDYPLNMTRKDPNPQNGVGHAVANDETEHMMLSSMGYEPKYVAPAPKKPTKTEQ